VNAVDSYDDSALMLAEDMGSAGVVQLLLQAGANVNAVNKYGDAALVFVGRAEPSHSWKGHAGVVQKVLQAGADVYAVNTTGESALMLDGREGHAEVVHCCSVAGLS
jgi:ankyrin repeat protein